LIENKGGRRRNPAPARVEQNSCPEFTYFKAVYFRPVQLISRCAETRESAMFALDTHEDSTVISSGAVPAAASCVVLCRRSCNSPVLRV
jgi:hypothetical protein